jgi:predicted peroxiredoxin
VKETKTPGADGDILSALEWIKENNTVNIPELIDDVIDNGVKYTGGIGNPNWMGNKVEKAIENGVKETQGCGWSNQGNAENAIKNGVKYTTTGNYEHFLSVENEVKLTNSSLQIDGSCVIEDVIENGVKKTKRSYESSRRRRTKDTIQNGVKNTYSDIVPQEYDWSDQFDVNDVIENGIQETHDDVYHHKGRVDGVIRNGVKVVIPAFRMIYNPMNFEPVISEEKRITDVTDVIRDGIKEVQPLPAQDGNRDWGVYYYRKGEPTKPHTKYVDEVIENGIKEN